MKDKKPNGILRIGILYDPEDKDLIIWKDKKPPPLIKPRKPPENDSKRRSKPS